MAPLENRREENSLHSASGGTSLHSAHSAPMKHRAIHQGTAQEVMAISVLTLCPTMLGVLPLCQGLIPAELARLSGRLHPSTVPADTIIMVHQPGEVAYLVLAGTLKVHAEPVDGSNVILALLGPGALVGEMRLVECCAFRHGRHAEADHARLDRRRRIRDLLRRLPSHTSSACTRALACCQTQSAIRSAVHLGERSKVLKRLVESVWQRDSTAGGIVVPSSLIFGLKEGFIRHEIPIGDRSYCTIAHLDHRQGDQWNMAWCSIERYNCHVQRQVRMPNN